MKNMRSFAATLIAFVLLAGCAQDAVADEENTIEEGVVLTPVEVMEAAPRDITNEILFTGQLAPIQQAMVVPRMQGLVSAVHADVGDSVEAGQLLFSLDGRDIQNQISALQAQHSQALANVATARNALSNVTGGQFETQLLQADTNIENFQIQLETNDMAMQNAQISYDLALNSYENTSILYAAGAVARVQYDQAQTAYEQAVIALEQARIGREQILAGMEQANRSRDILTGQISQENQDAAALGVSNAESAANVIAVQIQNASSQLSDLNVTSPISGVVNARNARVNEFATMQVPSFVVIDVSSLNVEVRVSEAIINQISPGDVVDVVVRSLGDEVLPGTVATVSPGVDQTNTFGVTIEIQNPDEKLRPGMFAEVRFVREGVQGALAVPVDAVQRNLQGQDYLFVVREGDIAQQVYVTTGISDGRNIEIISGISDGEVIVVRGQTEIADGQAVNVIGRIIMAN